MGVKPIASRPRQNRIMCEPCEYIFGCFGCNDLIQVVRWINTSKSRWNGHGISKTVFKVNVCIQIQSLFLRVQLRISEHCPVAEEATSRYLNHRWHYSDVIMTTMASQITGVSMVCSTVCSGADQRKHQRSAPLAFLRGIHRSPVDSPLKGPVTRKIFPFDDVFMV